MVRADYGNRALSIRRSIRPLLVLCGLLAELADALVLETSEKSWGFESLAAHQDILLQAVLTETFAT